VPPAPVAPPALVAPPEPVAPPALAVPPVLGELPAPVVPPGPTEPPVPVVPPVLAFPPEPVSSEPPVELQASAAEMNSAGSQGGRNSIWEAIIWDFVVIDGSHGSPKWTRFAASLTAAQSILWFPRLEIASLATRPLAEKVQIFS
jgi:hypothetical protein